MNDVNTFSALSVEDDTEEDSGLKEKENDKNVTKSTETQS